FRRKIRAPGDYPHAERFGDAGNTQAELAETDDAERLAFDIRSKRRLPELTRLQPRMLVADPSSQLQNQAEGDARGRIAERTCAVHGDAGLGCGHHVD